MPIVPNCPFGEVSAESLAIEQTASADDISCRQAATADDLRCFVSFEGIEEGVLGLGLYAHPRSSSQLRQGSPPDIDTILDYIDVDAFNRGVIHAGPSVSDRSGSSILGSLVSSSRKRLNGWLPLYINSQHWSRAKCYVPSAFALLSCGDPGAPFCARDALDICCSILTCAVVGFTKGQCESASARTAARARASEKAVQMFADVHRLLLQLAHDYPDIRHIATERLQEFIREPASRTRERTPSLGNLIHCLMISPEITWTELAPAFIPEACRRQVMREAWEGKSFDSRRCVGSTDALISDWDAFAPHAGKVISFCVAFGLRVARPHGLSLPDIEAMYDRRWGRLSSCAMADVIGACAHICSQCSIKEILPLMLPSSDGEFSSQVERISDAAVCEVILWAEEFGFSEEFSGFEEWPKLDGPYSRFEDWQREGHEKMALCGAFASCENVVKNDGWQEDWADRDGVLFGSPCGGPRSFTTLPTEAPTDCWQEDWFQHSYMQACQVEFAQWLAWQHDYQEGTQYVEFTQYQDVPSHDGPQYATAVA